MLTLDHLKQISGTPVKESICKGIIQFLPAACKRFEINTPLRIAHLLAQCCHETAHFSTLQEFASGEEYQGRLGNDMPGDGRKYKGRGMIQLTGKVNYKSYGHMLGLDLLGNPDSAASPEVSALTACAYWKDHNLNAAADSDDCLKVSKGINGINPQTHLPNGIEERKKLTARAKTIMDEIFQNFFDGVGGNGSSATGVNPAAPVTPKENNNTKTIDYPGRPVQEGETDAAIVKALKEKLNAQGFGPLHPDDPSFGPLMTSVVKLYQQNHTDPNGQPLPPTGIIDQLTWNSLM